MSVCVKITSLLFSRTGSVTLKLANIQHLNSSIVFLVCKSGLLSKQSLSKTNLSILFQDKGRVLNRSFVKVLQQHPSVIHSSSYPLHLNNSSIWKPNHCWQLFTTPFVTPPISKKTVSTQWYGFSFTVGKRKRYFYMFLFPQDRYFFLSGFTAYFLVLLNLGSSPVQPPLGSDTLQTTKAFFIALLISSPLFQSSCILNILIQLLQIAPFFHFTVTVTCTAWFSSAGCERGAQSSIFSLSYLLNG